MLSQGHAGAAENGEDAGAPLRLVETTVASNDARKRSMARKVIGALPDGGRDSRVAVLGLTFKPNTDDVRESPSLTIIPALQAAGAEGQRVRSAGH